MAIVKHGVGVEDDGKHRASLCLKLQVLTTRTLQAFLWTSDTECRSGEERWFMRKAADVRNNVEGVVMCLQNCSRRLAPCFQGRQLCHDISGCNQEFTSDEARVCWFFC